MARRTATLEVRFSPQQMYDLVVDMDRYPEFLPWCVRARKYEVKRESFRSEMTFAIKGLRETFHTLDRVEPGRRIAIEHTSGPFRYLESEWRFTATPRGARLQFFIDFRFKNPLLDLTLGPIFGEASRKMVDAFRDRANTVYS